MKSFLHTIAITIFIFFIVACSQRPKPLYNYENYAQNYYEDKKNHTPESALELQKAIEQSIANSDKSSSGRVPPGMYANLGYIYLKMGKSQEAIANFKKEKEVYPESIRFMDRMIKKVELAQGEK